MKVSADLRALEARLGYAFKDPDLLRTAVTHSSVSSATRDSYERLEFLGDRVLGLVMAEALLLHDPAASEGQLAPRYNALVRKETCAAVARDCGIGEALKLGRSEMLSGGRKKEALLADAMEAVIAAIYRDGGFAPAQAFVLRLWGDRIGSVKADARDPKTALQELLQAKQGAAPTYIEVARQGPDHAPTFTVEVRSPTGQTAQANAGSKRQAEQKAAQTLLAQLETSDD